MVSCDKSGRGDKSGRYIRKLLVDFQLFIYADGKMNVAASKSTLKHNLQATVSEHNCPISDTMIMI